MRTFSRYVLSILALFSVALVKAQTADEIIAKYFDAVGGKDKISQIKSMILESSVQVMGNDAPSVTTIVNGKGFKNESEFNGQKVIQCYSDKGGWAVNPFAGGTEAQAMPEQMYKSGKEQINIGGGLLNYASKGGKAELIGKENVGTVSAFKIKLTEADSTVTTYYFDPVTFYLLKLSRQGEMQGQPVEISISFSNYQKTDIGYVIPFGVETSFGEQFTLTGTVKKVTFNKDIDPKFFDMPK